MKRWLGILASIITVVGSYLPVDAYVLQGPHILDLMTGKLGKAKTMLVSQRLGLYETEHEMGAVDLSETVRYIFPKAFRSDISTENAERIYLVSKGRTLTIIDGEIAPESGTGFEVYKDIFLYDSRKRLAKRLYRLGVNVSIASLGRFQEKIVYVLGAQYPDASGSQLWIDKNTFLPLRWIIKRRDSVSNEDSIEIRYAQWRKTDTKWYAMRIEFYQDNVLVREIEVDHIRINPSFSNDLFDIERLESMYPPAPPAEPVASESEELNEVRKTIEEFKNIFE